MFPLFQSHLDLAHAYWQRVVRPGDLVVDATCGRGRDALTLAHLALTPESGQLWILDIQRSALDSAQRLLEEELSSALRDRIMWRQQCHSQFPAEILPGSARLICYNLGYLPGGDKCLTTITETTLASLVKAIELISFGGCISITLYPGHPEGAKEAQQVIEFAQGLHRFLWSCCLHRWVNRQDSPVLLLLQKEGKSTIFC